MIKFLLIAILLMTTPVMAKINKTVPGPIVAEVVRVIDGDTFVALFEIWPGILLRRSIRMDGFDTPEIKGKCASEKRRAQDAKKALTKMLGDQARLLNVWPGKFAGRVIARVETADGIDVAQAMIDGGFARVYKGGKRKGWCNGNG